MTDPLDRPFDAGLQAERTALAWQRTILAFAIAFLVAARLLVGVFCSLSFLLAAIGLVATTALFLLGHRRYRFAHTMLVRARGARVPFSSAVPLYVWVLTTSVLAGCGLAFALIAAPG
ncbi:hypothetical protein GCM10027052_01610 [Parafrigoribacterium mesophilum]|uniref:DUF202 domain-containing protein n=1 Tax=Parafrigoribacterium mesophilum TaxID=433646 RepID=UPI0031FCAC19